VRVYVCTDKASGREFRNCPSIFADMDRFPNYLLPWRYKRLLDDWDRCFQAGVLWRDEEVDDDGVVRRVWRRVRSGRVRDGSAGS
jgi:hypothetical protein